LKVFPIQSRKKAKNTRRKAMITWFSLTFHRFWKPIHEMLYATFLLIPKPFTLLLALHLLTSDPWLPRSVSLGNMVGSKRDMASCSFFLRHGPPSSTLRRLTSDRHVHDHKVLE